MRKTSLSNGEYYHVYNRGVDKREVFIDEVDYRRFFTCLQEFKRSEPIGSLYELSLREMKKGSSTPMGVELPFSALVEIVAYCLNPNHYHLIVKQISEKGIERFMQKIGTGYTNYFNKRYERSGALFQGKFKSIHIDSNEYLLHLSVYVNRNYRIHGYGDLDEEKTLLNQESEWTYCSATDYLGERQEGSLCNKDVILGQFKDVSAYKEFLDSNTLYFKEKKDFQKYLLEN
jgi:REP element-mobilizing transposase RayT